MIFTTVIQICFQYFTLLDNKFEKIALSYSFKQVLIGNNRSLK